MTSFLAASLGSAFLPILTQTSALAEETAPNPAAASSSAQTPWNVRLSTSDGGFWKKRIPLTLSISDELLANLKSLNESRFGSDAEQAGGTVNPRGQKESKTGMKSKLEPNLFVFTVVTPEEKAQSGQTAQSGAFPLPMAGAMAQDVRICDEKNVEYLFEILNVQNESQHSGVLAAGSKIIVPIELTTISQNPTFFVYFENSKSWILPDWWIQKRFANGSFEEGTKTPSSWVFDANDDTHQIAWCTDSVKDGAKSVKTTVADGAEPSWIGARQNAIPVIEGQRYRLSGWTKAENVKGYAGWFYHIGNASEGMIGSGMLQAGSGTFDWKQTTAEFTIPKNCDRLTIGTVLRGTGTAWADDVKLELLSDASSEMSVPCTVGDVETFPLAELFPIQGKAAGAREFDAARFFGSKELPRFAFVKITNATDSERSPLVNVNGSLVSARWGIELNAESVEILGLDGKSLPFETWGSNLFVTPTLPPQSVSYLILKEKPTAVSRTETARKERDQMTSDSAFPGTSLQGTDPETSSASSADTASIESIMKQNLVKNPGFEELNEAGKPAEWGTGPDSEGVSFNVVDPQSENASFGKVCAEIRVQEGGKSNWGGWRQSVPVQPGRTYFCGAWMKSPQEAGNFSIHIHFQNKDHQLVASNAMTSFSGSSLGAEKWSLVTGMIRTPDDAAFIALQLTSNDSNSYAYDNVFVTEMELGTPERFLGGRTGIFQVPPIIKVFPDSTWPLNSAEGNGSSFHAVATSKNEEETIQFAFRYASDRNYQIALEPAVSANGKTTLPTELFAVGYVPIKHVTSYYSDRSAKWFRKLPNGSGHADGWVGYWPDPLIRFANLADQPKDFGTLEDARKVWSELENADYSSDSERLCRFGEQNLIGFKAWETRALTVIVKTGKEIPAGVYSGKIRFRSLETGKVTFIPFSVDVKNFAIPDEPACGAIYDCRASHPEYWNEKEGKKIVNQMVEFLASKRLASDRLSVEPKFSYDQENGTWSADFEEFDAACEHYFTDLKVRYSYLPGDWYCFGWGMPPRARQGIQPYEGEWPFTDVDRSKLRPEFKKAYQEKLRLFWDHLKEKGWAKHFVLYISDEPFYSQPHIITQMQACCEMIHEVDPEIPIYASTWGHVPEWDGHITVWGIGHYGRVPEEQIRKSKERGDRIWWTTDGQMCTDTPFCATERLLPYWCMKYGADAYEFWGASWFTYDPYRYGWHSYIFQSDQPGVEYYVLYPNGDGFIFYPDKLLGVNEIVSSIRLEQAREGVEDAACISILRDEIARVKALQSRSDASSRTLLNAENTLSRIYDLVHIPNAGGRFTSHYLPNPEEVDEVKGLMLQLIDDLKKIH